MDDKRFALLAKTIQQEMAVRRGAVKGVLAATLGLSLGKLALNDAEAKKKCKKKKCPTCPTCPNCPPACKSCTEGNSANGCCEIECCLGLGEPEGGDTICRPEDMVCCTADEGGGFCPRSAPFCCPPSDEFPQGSCEANLDDCPVPLLTAASGRSRHSARRGS